jgi:hypothetical protein
MKEMKPFMKTFDLPIQKNKLETKEDLQLALSQLCAPLEPFFSKGRAALHVGNTSATYADATADMEGFSRLLWGLVPLLCGGGESILWPRMLTGIKNGTNPTHPEYWGEIADYDQCIVEMAAYGFALTLIPEKVWEPLSKVEKGRLAAWLCQINQRKAYDCNWLLFRVLVNLGFRRVGVPYDKEKVEESLSRIEAFYLGDGWYSDGLVAHRDYYVSFAIHYYCLLYAKIMEKDDPKRSELYKSRAAEFAKSFMLWFSPDGSALPYGRSMTYRFAQCAFWGAFAFAGVNTIEPGVVKGLILRHLRWWFRQPIFDAQGVLTIGYGYPNLVMAESYNSPGSPYWALKAFLPLALPDDDSFWANEEKPLPELPEKALQQAPHLVVCRKGNHIAAFNAGNAHTNDHTHTAAKYEKFVYSNLFGFSVSRGEYGLSQGAFDSTLALSEGDGLYRMKRCCTLLRLTENEICVEWNPWPDVVIKTSILPGLPWHVRIHHIKTGRRLEVADGGFALGLVGLKAKEEPVENGLAAITELWVSGAVPLYGGGSAALIYANPDTNLLQPRTVIPTVQQVIEQGEAIIVNAFYGDSAMSEITYKTPPCAIVKDGKLIVTTNDGTHILFDGETA